MIIAVDFDGTIVEHRYPQIGKKIPFAIETLKKLQVEHHQLILWTVREGKQLREAVEYCRSHGIVFSAVNNNIVPGLQEKMPCLSGQCKKIIADIFIDDRNVGGLPDWGLIYKMITEQLSYTELRNFMDGMDAHKKNGRWFRLKQLLCFWKKT